MPRLTTAVAASIFALCVPGVADASAATPHQVAPGDCGPTVSKPGGASWMCAFVDDFNGTSLDRTKWHPQINFATGASAAPSRSCHVDDPANVAVRQGALQLTVRRVETPVVCKGAPAHYTSGQVSTYRLFSQQYGRFEARVKVHFTFGFEPGLQESFWLWPDDRVASGVQWPAAGEIDIAELYSQYNWAAVPFLHYRSNNNGGPRPGLNTAYCPAARGQFNTYTLIWTPRTLTIQVNGKTCLVNRSGDPAFQKPYIAVFTSALGVGRNALRWNTPIPATMAVDYFRVWR
jgi:beta-glucanase (GH16 family)